MFYDYWTHTHNFIQAKKDLKKEQKKEVDKSSVEELNEKQLKN